jgi:hypothetical protein
MGSQIFWLCVGGNSLGTGTGIDNFKYVVKIIGTWC